MDDYKCRVCGSENTQRLSVLHLSGKSKTKLAGIGIGVGQGLGLGVGIGGGKNQTALSAMAAPPKTSSPLVNAVGAWFITLMIGSFISNIVNGDTFLTPFIAFLSFFFACAAYISTKKKNEAKLKKYQDRFICLRCGADFLVM
jgi:hypothetical protein